MDAENDSLAKRRVHALDFLRGLYIILAMIQHYTGVLNGSLGLRPDGFIQWLFYNLTPSGDHLFLALAAFNIGKRTPTDYRPVYWSKMGIYASLFVFFFFESFFRTFDLGQALTWGPLLTWMLVLMLLASIHRCFGCLGVLILFFAQTFFWALPMDSLAAAINESVRSGLQLPTFQYESRLEYFIGSGCVGYLLGYFHHHGKSFGRLPKHLLSFSAGLLLTVPFWLYGEYWVLNLDSVWDNEYLVASQFVGIMYIWGVQAAAIAFAILLEQLGVPMKIPIFDWCGRFSFLVFAVHYAFFFNVMLPLRVLIARLYDLPLQCTIEEMCIYMAGTILFSLFLQRSGLLLFMHYQGASKPAPK
ncbi:MAG: hypothetical protein KDD66_04855 [Bdellovibrionales bacterium]|nr:hypothetical protein [Bdellovibrionales bacterium]